MVVVTTEHRGVFAGDPAEPLKDKQITLKNARMCIYWSTDVKGVVGLAATGPTKNCKITAPAPAITLEAVTAVMECSPEAAKAWEAEPWAR
jgi:hypothetical protein